MAACEISSLQREGELGSLGVGRKIVQDDQREAIKDLTAAKISKPLPQALTVLNGFADRPAIVHSTSRVLTTLFIRGRCFGSNCRLSNQKPRAMSAVARANFRFCHVRRWRNAREIMALAEELSAIYPKRALLEMYETAMNVEPRSFWLASLIAKSKPDMFYVRLDQEVMLG